MTVILPALAEPHAHLDKAFLAERIPNPTGDLMGAILAMEEARPTITVADTVERAERAARLMLANGVTAIRTHADVTAFNGLTSAEALIEVRRRLAGEVAVQVVALTGWPVLGPAGAVNRRLLTEAVEMGVDLVGGCPHLEDDPDGATEFFLEVAAGAELGVDLHTDETLRPDALALSALARRVLDTGFAGRVTASHCVSLGMLAPDRQRAIAELVAEAGIGVIALPQTNLFLQGRDHQQAMPRGVTAVQALRQAGVRVAAGADNLQDPFNPVGRADPLEIAGLMMLTCHLLPDDAVAAVSTVAREVMGLAPTADTVECAGESVREAVAWAGPRRLLRR